MIAREKELFFERMDELELALTFDDVRMQTRSGRDYPLPEVLDIQSSFSENVGLKVPLVSAAMDTVTTGDMAIAMAKIGGLGVVHGAMSIDQQRKEISRVKNEIHGLIDNPICVNVYDTIDSVLNLCNEKRYDFKTFPVVNAEGKFVGMLTSDSFKYAKTPSATVAETMTPPDQVMSSKVGTTLNDAYHIMQDHRINTLPILTERGEVGGMYLFSDVERIFLDSVQYNVDNNGQLRVAAAVSTGKDTLERVEALSKYVDVVVIDTADGDSYYAFKTLEDIKSVYPDLDVVVGNISDGKSARQLAEAGANGIKVGQGPGSICSTRRETGIGMPQVTAVYECVKALGNDFAHIPVCADGGIKEHGDIPIAFAAGAHSVMMGRMLAGTQEAPGEVFTRGDGSRWKIYRGMGSAEALAQNEASRERYAVNNMDVLLAEGVVARVPFEGSINDVLPLCVQALRKGMRYCKAPDLTYHRESTLFKRITNAGLRESYPHDIEALSK